MEPKDNSNNKKMKLMTSIITRITVFASIATIVALFVQWQQTKAQLIAAEESSKNADADVALKETALAIAVEQRDLQATIAVSGNDTISLQATLVELNKQQSTIVPNLPTVPLPPATKPILSTATINPSLTPTRTPSLGLPFLENFDSGSLQRWSAFGSEAKFLEGTFVLIGRPLVVALVGLESWHNYSFKARVKLVSGSDFGILVGADDTCSLYQMQFVSGNLRMARYDGKTCPSDYSWTELSLSSYPIDQGKWYEIRMDFQSPLITGYVNGAKAISVEDAFYQSGKVGFRTYDSQIFVDDMQVSPISNP